METINNKDFRCWWERVEGDNKHELSAMAAWDFQQKFIDSRNKEISELEERIRELEDKEWKSRRKLEVLNKEIEDSKEIIKDNFIFHNPGSIKEIISFLVKKYKENEAEYAALAIVFSHLPKEEFTVKKEGSYIFVKEWDKFRGYFDKIRTSEALNKVIKNLANLYKFRRYCSRTVNCYNYIYDEHVKELKEKLKELDTANVILEYDDERTKILERAEEYEKQGEEKAL